MARCPVGGTRRSSVTLYGVATRLRSEARRFRWQPLRKARDAYIADLLTGLAEEVAKLLRALETGEKETASVQRNLLANRMAFLWLLSQESLWETENGLWETAGQDLRGAVPVRATYRAGHGPAELESELRGRAPSLLPHRALDPGDAARREAPDRAGDLPTSRAIRSGSVRSEGR